MEMVKKIVRVWIACIDILMKAKLSLRQIAGLNGCSHSPTRRKGWGDERNEGMMRKIFKSTLDELTLFHLILYAFLIWSVFKGVSYQETLDRFNENIEMLECIGGPQ